MVDRLSDGHIDFHLLVYMPSPWVWAGPVTCFQPLWQKWSDTILIIMLHYIRLHYLSWLALKSCSLCWLWRKKLSWVSNCKKMNSSNNISELGNKPSPTGFQMRTRTLLIAWFSLADDSANLRQLVHRNCEIVNVSCSKSLSLW